MHDSKRQSRSQALGGIFREESSDGCRTAKPSSRGQILVRNRLSPMTERPQTVPQGHQRTQPRLGEGLHVRCLGIVQHEATAGGESRIADGAYLRR
jgi:hypothetical protein